MIYTIKAEQKRKVGTDQLHNSEAELRPFFGILYESKSRFSHNPAHLLFDFCLGM